MDLCAITDWLTAGLFRFIPPLRRIEISDAMAEHHYLGAYFGSRLEHTPGTENVDWKLLGWDGEPRMMLFPHIPPEWVILHEFGHYLDDTFVRAIHHYNERLVHPDSAFIMESLNRDRLDEFADLHRDMWDEFQEVQWRGQEAVLKEHGSFSSPNWWHKIPEGIVYRDAPTAYAYVTFAEWFAECFRTLCIWRDSSSLFFKAPKTSAFMRFFFSGKIFRKPTREISYVPFPEYALSEAASEK